MKSTAFQKSFSKISLALFALGAMSLDAEDKGPKRGDAILPVDFSKEADRAKWNLGDFAAWVPEGKKGNTVLKVTVGADKSPGHQKAGMTIDLSPYKGMKLLFECEVKAKDVSKPPQSYNGVKFMIHFKSAATGEKWINENNVYGTFDWRTLTAVFTVPTDLQGADYNLGLENSTGTVWFESPRVTVLAAQLPARPKPAANPPPAFTGHDGIPRLRGVMSPNTFKEEDFKTLSEWNVNLVRWQINRNWGASGTEVDLDDYDKWIDSKMTELDAALKTAQGYGIKLVIDLHTPPGGRLKDMSMRMFYEKKYQDHFVKVWETFAKRYKGNPAVWAYDLVNEPVENTPAAPGQSFWETQVRAAKAIRAVDAETPIVIESEAFDSPEAFATLMPVDVPRVIYQVHMYMPGEFTHQGVYNTVTNIRYPGTISGRKWDKETLRTALAPVREFQLAYNVHIYAGEFSAIRWAPGADQYLRDCAEIFEEYGWDWSYHAFREWPGWSVEYEDQPADRDKHVKAVTDTARKKVLLDFYSKNVRPGAKPEKRAGAAGVPIQKILFMGDSLTKHGPAEKLGWSGNYGMAASAEENDYVHLLVSKIATAQGAKPELLIHAVGGGTISGKLSNFAPSQVAGADLVVIQLGENDRDASEDGFEKPYEALLKAVRGAAPSTRIYCLGVWKGSPEKDDMIQTVVRRQGCVFVDIKPAWADPAGSAEAEKRFTNVGVNWHPGDKGMQAYADALWKSFQENPKMPAPDPAAKRKVKAAAVVETVFEDPMDDASSKKWQPAIYQYETGKNGKALSIRNDDASRSQSVSLNLPVDKIKGKKITVSALVKAENVSTKPKPYNGIKLMLISSDAEARKDFPQAPLDAGTFDWKPVSFTYVVHDMAVSVQLVLGLEVVSGKALFDDIKVIVEK